MPLISDVRLPLGVAEIRGDCCRLVGDCKGDSRIGADDFLCKICVLDDWDCSEDVDTRFLRAGAKGATPLRQPFEGILRGVAFAIEDAVASVNARSP